MTITSSTGDRLSHELVAVLAIADGMNQGIQPDNARLLKISLTDGVNGR